MRIASLFHSPQWGVQGAAECYDNQARVSAGNNRIRLEIRGNTLIGYINSVAVIRCQDNTNRQLPQSGNPAFFLAGADASIDNFTAGSISTAAPGNLPALQQMNVTIERPNPY